MTLSMVVTCEPGITLPIDEARLELVAACALEAGGYTFDSEVEINLCCVDEQESTRLNGAWRDKHYPTNILTFVAGAELPDWIALGDLVICMPVVEREAREQGKTVADHVQHLVVHGVLHLLGFDHIGDDEARSMETLERHVLAGFDIRDPYAPSKTEADPSASAESNATPHASLHSNHQ